MVEAGTGQVHPGPQEASHLVAWSPDGRLLAAKGPGHTVGLWDAVTFRPVRTLEGGGNLLVTVLAWSPDAKFLAAGGEDHVWVWSAETGKLRWCKDKQNNVTALAWTADGERLASTEWGNNGDRGGVHIWQAGTGKLLHESPVCAYRVAWSPDGRTLAVSLSSTSWQRVALLDPVSGKLLGKAQEDISGVAFRWSSEGQTFSTASFQAPDSACICDWDGRRCTRLRTKSLHRTMLVAWADNVAWSPDGRVLAWADESQIYLGSGGHSLGVLLPFDVFGRLAITPDGRYRGSARVERLIRMVVQKRDGSSETLTPQEFEQKYGFKNDPEKVRLMDGLSAK
jgi:WD40 repeat protein